MYSEVNKEEHPLGVEFKAFIDQTSFPCVGAKSAAKRERLEISIARTICSSWNDLDLIRKLHDFVDAYRKDPQIFTSFAVIFEGPTDLSEREFETHFWDRLQSLSDKDSFFGSSTDQRTASDPGDADFAMSFGGEGFFIVGLHPKASRPARRFHLPVMVFNVHSQFVALREQGHFEKLKQKINERDVALAGTPNPMLMDHGTASSARQFSGRAVRDDWKCPFQRNDYSWPKHN